MSRSNKPRNGKYDRGSGGGHGYRSLSGVLQWVKYTSNRMMRRHVKERMKDLLYTDAWDEEKVSEHVGDFLDRWYYD